MANLITLAEFKEHQDIQPDDGSRDVFLQNALDRAWDYMESDLRRSIGTTTYASKKFNGNGTKILMLEKPITTFTSLYIEDELIPSTEYDVDMSEGVVYYENGFKEGYQNISVNYVAGYDETTLPDRFRQACFIVAEVFRVVGKSNLTNESRDGLSLGYITEAIPKQYFELLKNDRYANQVSPYGMNLAISAV